MKTIVLLFVLGTCALAQNAHHFLEFEFDAPMNGTAEVVHCITELLQQIQNLKSKSHAKANNEVHSDGLILTDEVHEYSVASTKIPGCTMSWTTISPTQNHVDDINNQIKKGKVIKK